MQIKPKGLKMSKKHLKTDMLMKVAFPHGTIEIYHKTEMGNLKQVFNMGNKYRLDNNESTIELEKFLKRQVTKNFISTLMEVNDCERKDIIKVVGRGRGAITYANLQFLIYCAMQLSTKFQVHVINKFIENDILVNRDMGGMLFKELNKAIDSLPDRINSVKEQSATDTNLIHTKNNQGIYIYVAKAIRSFIFTPSDLYKYGDNQNIWNSECVEPKHLSKRIEIEKRISEAIEFGFITEYYENDNKTGLKDILPRLLK